MGGAAVLLELPGTTDRNLARDRGSNPQRDGRVWRLSSAYAAPEAAARPMLTRSHPRVGLGRSALCGAFARQLGHRGHGRPSPSRAVVEGPEQVAIELEPLRAKAQALNDRRLIDYDEVFRLKSKALEAIFKVAPDPPRLGPWAHGKGQALRDFATYNALAEEHGPAWRTWPPGLRHPKGEGVDAERRRLGRRVAFHVWQQFHLDRQLARASREIGLITDVPVGFASDGFDAWRWQDLLAPNMRVGAPPDEFFRDGQDWGLPPFDPWNVRRAQYDPFVGAIRCAPAHAAGIRLDHVMGLFRLFWIPDGMTAAQGAYVRYPAATLLAILANESRRANAFVIGEDLGLVEPAVRGRLRQRGALSYRLLWFEGPTPDQWPKNSVAAVG